MEAKKASIWGEPEPPRLQKCGKILHPEKFMGESSKLYEQQREALNETVEWFSRDKTKDYTAVIVMPTGSGKSGVIACLPYTLGWAAQEKKIKIDLKKPILVLAPKLEILKQLRHDLECDASEHNPFLVRQKLMDQADIDKQRFYRVYVVESGSNVKNLRKIAGHNDIILTNAQKWHKESKPGIELEHANEVHTNYEDMPGDLFSAIIVDEAHHLPAPQWQEIVDKFKAKAKVIFFTATPYRADGQSITTDDAINTHGFAYELKREVAIAKGLIRRVEFLELNNNDDEKYAETLEKVKLMNILEKMKSEEAVSSMIVLEKVKSMVDTKNRECPLPGVKKHSAIVITKDTASAEIVKKMCQVLGYEQGAIMNINSETIKPRQRDKAIENIKNGKFEVVIVVDMLREGFDYPPLSVAGIITKIVSPVKFDQFVGRVRRIMHSPEIEAHVITHEYFQQRKKFDEYQEPKIPQVIKSQKLSEKENGTQNED